MSSTYLTETEQVALLKAWWKRYHRWILLALSVLFLCISAMRYWQWRQQAISEQASNAFEHLMVAYSNHQTKAVLSYSNQLMTSYPKTVYADTARLIEAKLEIEQGHFDRAIIALNRVVTHAQFPVLVDVAHMRLARIYAYQKQYDNALMELKDVSNPSYKPLISELKGDIYQAQGQMQQALSAYQQAKAANEHADAGNSFLDMKQQAVVASQQSQNATRKV